MPPGPPHIGQQLSGKGAFAIAWKVFVINIQIKTYIFKLFFIEILPQHLSPAIPGNPVWFVNGFPMNPNIMANALGDGVNFGLCLAEISRPEIPNGGLDERKKGMRFPISEVKPRVPVPTGHKEKLVQQKGFADFGVALDQEYPSVECASEYLFKEIDLTFPVYELGGEDFSHKEIVSGERSTVNGFYPLLMFGHFNGFL
jgi:hypothetical protein